MILVFTCSTEGGKALPSDPKEDAADPADLYKQVQKGGDIPIRGLQKPGPEKPASKLNSPY